MFPRRTVQTILAKTTKLVDMGLQRGERSAAYTDIMVFDLRNILIRMSIIQAACKGRSRVLVRDVEEACIDLNMIWGLQLDFVSTNVTGRLDYQNHLDDRLRRCLQILDEHKCHSEAESTLSIEEFDDLIRKELKMSESSARNTYRKKLRDMGLIECRQLGKHSSRVWLTREGYACCHPSTLSTLNRAGESDEPSKDKATIAVDSSGDSKP